MKLTNSNIKVQKESDSRREVFYWGHKIGTVDKVFYGNKKSSFMWKWIDSKGIESANCYNRISDAVNALFRTKF